jgi:hypothetical protein
MVRRHKLMITVTLYYITGSSVLNSLSYEPFFALSGDGPGTQC